MPACHAASTCSHKHVFSCSANPGTTGCVWVERDTAYAFARMLSLSLYLSLSLSHSLSLSLSPSFSLSLSLFLSHPHKHITHTTHKSARIF